MKEDQEFKVILGYIADLRPAWDTQDCHELPTQEGGRAGIVSLLITIIKNFFLNDKNKKKASKNVFLVCLSFALIYKHPVFYLTWLCS